MTSNSTNANNKKTIRRTGETAMTKLRNILLASVSVTILLAVAPASAEDCKDDCGGSGFSISVDGERLAGDAVDKSQTGASSSDIQVKYDGLEVKPLLNVYTQDMRRSYRAGEDVEFFTSLNYPSWVAKKEVRIYDTSDKTTSKPIAVVDVGPDGRAAWTMPEDGKGEYSYVLRVTDEKNRFDETVSLGLSRTTSVIPEQSSISTTPGYSEDRTAIRNIPVYGGAVTVYGTNVPAGESVHALGEEIPVDREGNFVVQRILPPGDHRVDVLVSGGEKEGLDFSRDINIPQNDWFYVALADATIGKRFGSDAIEAANPDDYDGVYSKGRLAFYLKGKIKGRTLLTASADTGEGKFSQMFSGFDSKDPRELLRRIDPDSFYPVYGDDSTIVDGAPTRGKFYVRLDRGDSHVMWGKYKAEINKSKLLRNERALYGAQGVYRSEATTSFGERKVEAKVYAAQPGTLPQRDILRGTGGSAYFLKRQDVSPGTDTVTVVVSDPVSGRIISRRQLIAGQDYDINYLQGVVILKNPLQSTTAEDTLVREGALGGNRVDLVVNYEFSPPSGTVDGYSYGGEAAAWLGEHVRVGVTGMDDETGIGDQKSAGANIQLRATDSTFLEGEFAQTKGPGFSKSLSTDGGLTNIDDLLLDSNQKGEGWRMRGELDLSDINSSLKGNIAAWYEQKTAGFATLDQTLDADQRVAGISGRVEITEHTELRGTFEDYEDDDGRAKRDASVEVEQQVTEQWAVAVGATHTKLENPDRPLDENGQRVDVGTKVTYSPNDDTKLYVFGQATVDRKDDIRRNDRIGVGAKRKLTDKLGVEGEVSEGTTGIGALAALTYDPTPDDHYYGGYRLDPDSWRNTSLVGTDLGGIVVGAKRKYNDVLSGYAENNYDMYGKQKSLTSTYGVVYTPDTLWTVTGGLELGQIEDPNASDFDRKAVSLATGFKDEDKISATLKGEVRFEESQDGTRDRDSYLFAGAVSYKANEDWRLLGGIDAVVSNSDQSAFLDGDYIEGSAGFAYRPASNDRLNVLAKYQFLYDLPGPDQVTVNGTTYGPAQRSHVFSIDGNYDLTKWLAVGGKYGVRFGEVSTTRSEDDFVGSSAQLAVLRADVKFWEQWSALLEGRMLSTKETQTRRYGTLVALYRNMGEHMKVGAGYNFADFSDDLTDLTYDDQGVFINAVGKF